jgi:hypothetical protein
MGQRVDLHLIPEFTANFILFLNSIAITGRQFVRRAAVIHQTAFHDGPVGWQFERENQRESMSGQKAERNNAQVPRRSVQSSRVHQRPGRGR